MRLVIGLAVGLTVSCLWWLEWDFVNALCQILDETSNGVGGWTGGCNGDGTLGQTELGFIVRLVVSLSLRLPMGVLMGLPEGLAVRLVVELVVRQVIGLPMELPFGLPVKFAVRLIIGIPMGLTVGHPLGLPVCGLNCLNS